MIGSDFVVEICFEIPLLDVIFFKVVEGFVESFSIEDLVRGNTQLFLKLFVEMLLLPSQEIFFMTGLGHRFRVMKTSSWRYFSSGSTRSNSFARVLRSSSNVACEKMSLARVFSLLRITDSSIVDPGVNLWMTIDILAIFLV